MSDFKKLMQDKIIPAVERMLEKEQKHHKYLIDNDAPYDFLVRSRHFQEHYKLRIEQYKEYCNG